MSTNREGNGRTRKNGTPLTIEQIAERTSGKIPWPADIEAERALLHEVFISSEFGLSVFERLGDFDADDSPFLYDRHVILYKAMKELHGRGEKIDVVPVGREIARLTSVANAPLSKESIKSLLLEALTEPPKANNEEAYLEAVLSDWQRRRLVLSGLRIAALASDPAFGSEAAEEEWRTVLTDISSSAEHVASIERSSIPQSVYDDLPACFGEICRHLGPAHERDLVLIGMLIVCSGILSNVEFFHRDRWYHLNLYALVTADTGSGKGDAGFAWKIAEKIEERLRSESLAERALWERRKSTAEAVRLRNREHTKKQEALEDLPDEIAEPLPKTLSIAANSSARGFIDRLIANGGMGIVFDTETKTLTIARNQEWGETEAYLKGFHNEIITIDRKGGIPIRLLDPCFAAFLTGTPQATASLIPSAEDGLFSRFLHYWFKAPTVWRSQRPSDRDKARNEALARAAETMDSLHRALSAKEKLLVTLSEPQWDQIDDTFRAVTNAMSVCKSDTVLHANVRRAALISARIASILAVLRAFEHGRLPEGESIETSDADVRSGLAVAMTCLSHAIELAKTLKISADAHMNGPELTVYAALAEKPARITSQEIADKTGFNIRKVQRLLKRLNNRGLLHDYSGKGPYARAAAPGDSRI